MNNNQKKKKKKKKKKSNRWSSRNNRATYIRIADRRGQWLIWTQDGRRSWKQVAESSLRANSGSAATSRILEPTGPDINVVSRMIRILEPTGLDINVVSRVSMIFEPTGLDINVVERAGFFNPQDQTLM